MVASRIYLQSGRWEDAGMAESSHHEGWTTSWTYPIQGRCSSSLFARASSDLAVPARDLRWGVMDRDLSNLTPSSSSSSCGCTWTPPTRIGRAARVPAATSWVFEALSARELSSANYCSLAEYFSSLALAILGSLLAVQMPVSTA